MMMTKTIIITAIINSYLWPAAWFVQERGDSWLAVHMYCLKYHRLATQECPDPALPNDSECKVASVSGISTIQDPG